MIHNAAGISGCVVVIVKIDDFVLSVSVDIIDTVKRSFIGFKRYRVRYVLFYK